MKVLRNRILISLVLFLLLFSLIPMSPVSALVWNPGVTFSCDNEYYSTTTPLTVDNISVDTHWVSVNGIGYNVSFGGTVIYINFSSIKSSPKSNNGWITNWTAQKQTGTIAYYTINGLKPNYGYILYNNLSGTFPKTTTASGTFTINMSSPYTNIQYKIEDPGIPAGWYVSTTGSDTTGTGTLINPFKTLQKAINASTTSDDIYMRGGTYLPSQTTFVNRSGTSGDWYTIQNYPGETVIINGSYANYGDKSINATIMLRNADYVRITGLTINRSRSGGISMYSSPGTCDYTRIDNCTISNSSCSAIRSYIGNSYLYLENNYLYNNFCNWYGHASGTLSQEIISLSGVSYGYIYGNRLWKNRVEQIDMKSGCSWMYVHDNTINTTADGVMRNFWLTGGIGVYIDARGTCHNVSIYNNLIYGNHTGIQISNEGSSGRYENITIYNNIINVTNTTGGKPAPDGRMGIYIGKEGSSSSLNKDIKIYMNTVNLGTGNKYPCFQAGSTSYPLSTSLMKRLNVSNNVFTNNNKTSTSWWQYLNTAHIQIEGFSSTVSATYLKFNNNLYNNSFAGTCRPQIAWDDGSYYQTSTSKWGNSPVMTPPEYVSPNPVFNPYLNATSPCIGAATSSLVASTDYDGVTRPQGGTYDIGALEYTGVYIPSFIFSTVSPVNTSTGVSLTPTLQVHIEETHGYQFNYTISENTTGAYVNQKIENNQNNGTFTVAHTNATAYSTKYWWKVTATNSTTTTTAIYYFTTLAPATPSFLFTGIVPVNSTTGVAVQPDVYFTLNETNGYLFNYTISENATGIWETIHSSTLSANTSSSSWYGNASSYVTKYWWKITAWNGTTSDTRVYHFTTTTAPAGPPTTEITLHRVKANWTTTTSIYLSWTKGANTTNTYIYRSETGYLTGASLIYSGTNSYYNDTLKNPTIRYYYTLKPYNSVSSLYGTPLNVSLAETDNTSITTSSSALFKGWLGTDKNIWTNFRYSSSQDFTTTSVNLTTKTEYYEGLTPFSYTGFYDPVRRGQTFTTETTRYYLYVVSFKMFRSGTPGVTTLDLYSANLSGAGAGLPTGAILASTTKDLNSITTATTGEWVNFTLPVYRLLSNTKYALVLHCAGSGANTPFILYDSPLEYAEGNKIRSADTGATYFNETTTPTGDYLFRVFGHTPYATGTGMITSNETTTTTSLIDILQTNLQPGQIYYYKESGNDSNGNMTLGNMRYTLTNPDIPVFLNILPSFGNSSVRISWLDGAGANRTVVVRSNIAYPTYVADGVTVYNDTGSLCWVTNISFNTTYYFSLFSYTTWAGLSRFSSGVHIPWGGVTYIVRNESKPWQVINASMIVTDRNGLYPMQFNNIYGYYSFNISQIPYGVNTLFYVSNSSYHSSLYPITINPNIFYNFSFYLPPIISTGPGSPPGGNLTGSYMIQVMTTISGPTYDQTLPVDGALVQFYRYFNTTGNYTYIRGFVSDGNGQGSVDLYPYQLYMVKISCDGYENKTDFWTPNVVEQGLIKVFKIAASSEQTIPPEYDDFWSIIRFTATMNETNVTTIVYYDPTGNTVNTSVYFYEFYNGSLTLITIDNRTGDNSFSFTVSGLNYTRTYIVVLRFNSTNDFQIPNNKVIITVGPLHSWPLRERFDLEKRITDIFGDFKVNGVVFSWIGFFLSFIPIIVLTLFDPAHVGIGILASGMTMAGIQGLIFAWTTNAPPPLIIVLVPVIFVIGILYLFAQRNGYL